MVKFQFLVQFPVDNLSYSVVSIVYTLYARLLHLLIMEFIVSFLSTYYLHLLFRWVFIPCDFLNYFTTILTADFSKVSVTVTLFRLPWLFLVSKLISLVYPGGSPSVVVANVLDSDIVVSEFVTFVGYLTPNPFLCI